jgi:hypothetical protein
MPRRRLGTPKKKAKKVAYRFIEPGSDDGRPMYRLLRSLIETHHEDNLRDAKIALAWNLSWSPDADGRVTLGKCKKVADLEREITGAIDRELQPFDFVIILHRGFWTDEMVTDRQRRALLDHELCHAAIKLDLRGEPEVDERGRHVYRIRKHDIEEFACIVERHGCYKADIEQFYDALQRGRMQTSTDWVGFTALQRELRDVGATIPLELIVEWSEDERREARTWAILRQQTPNQVERTPAHIARAMESGS